MRFRKFIDLKDVLYLSWKAQTLKKSRCAH